MAVSSASEPVQTGQDVEPWELVTCQRLTDQIRSISAAKSTLEVPYSVPTSLRSLDEALRDAVTTIRFNAKWFAEPALATLLETALNAAATSSASADLYAAVTFIDIVGIYSILPPQSLQQAVRFISQTYYGATRAYKTKKLADATWTTLRHILESHLGSQTVVALLEIVSSGDQAHLESKIGYAQVAGALMIISEKMVLKDDARLSFPTPGLSELLDSLWSAALNGSDNMRELILEIIAVVLANDNSINSLDEQSSWDALLETLESCVALSPKYKASQSAIEGLVCCIDHFESRQLPTVALLAVDVNLPLTALLSEAISAPWEDILSTRDMPNGLMGLLKKLCRSSQYTAQLERLVEMCLVKLFLWEPERAALTSFVRSCEGSATDSETTSEAASVLAKALVSIFEDAVRSHGRDWEQNLLFDVLCKMSLKCLDAAKALFKIRAYVEGAVYFERKIHAVAAETDKSFSLTRNSLHDVPSLPLQKWDEAILAVLQGSADWEIYHYFLTALPSLLGNHSMFEQRVDFIRRLRAVVCELIESGDYPEPPVFTGITKSHVTMALVQVLTALLSYHRILSKQDSISAVSIFLNTAGSRDYIISIPCVHALTISCYELSDLMSSYMDDVIDKMSKMVTQRYLAIHVLLFLAGLSRQPDLFRNFQTHDYKKIFGVCGSYLQSIRGTSALLERQQTPSSDQSSKKSLESSDALPQYVYALAHHVIAFWYLALKSHDRRGLKDYITSCLRYTTSEGDQVIEDQGLVTIDLMDRVDAEESHIEADDIFDGTDGRITTLHRLSGLLLISTKTALRTGKTIATIRRATGTSRWVIAPPDEPSSIAITMESTNEDYLPVYPDDSDGRTYGKLHTPRPDSAIGSSTTLSLLEDDTFTRAIQTFDRTTALDSHKAGIIYVGEHQTIEDEILMNGMGSPDYVEFVRNLGSLRRLKDATFNTQGLDRVDDADGQHTIVWHNQVTELVFHVTTLMPINEDTNLNTANKKRHTGNDHVNIIFNNSGSPFDFNTFPSQFNSVYIVISPSSRTSFLQTRAQDTIVDNRKDRFYAVHVLTRPGYPSISSAAEEKVVSGTSLPGYVRNLALNECIFSSMWEHKEEPGEYPSSWRNRLMQIRRLWDRYGTK